MTIRRIVYVLASAALLLCIMQISGCTFVTNFKEYDLRESNSDAPNGVNVYLSFTPTRYRYMRLPGLYDLERYRDPYHCHFTIWGDFVEITEIDVSMAINNGRPIAIPVDVNQLNRNRKLSHNAAPYFPAGEIPFNAKADEIELISVTTKISAIVAQHIETYTITNDYSLTVNEETGNRWWLAAMGI